MNPYVYDEYKVGSRHAPEHFRKSLGTGAVPALLALWIGVSRFPHGGPGLYAACGLALAGLLMLWSARQVHRERDVSRFTRWLVRYSDAWYPSFVLVCQNFFVGLTVMLLWLTVCELGYAASWLQHTLLLLLLALSPLRRILHGTEPMNPSPLRELFTEALGYLHATLLAVFLASSISIALLPPDKPLTGALPLSVVMVWVPAVLVIITCVILLIDHILRKMPQPAPPEAKDGLD
jgi:hypothetical protein